MDRPYDTDGAAPAVLQGWETGCGRLLFASETAVTRFVHCPLARPAATVIESLFRHAPERFLRSVAAATGQSLEGVVSFGFHGEYPDEIPPGHVSVDYLDEEAHVRDADFAAVAVSMAVADAMATPNTRLLAVLRATLGRLARDGRGEFHFLLRFEPKFRVLVYDAHPEASSASADVLAEILSDGRRGRVTVNDPDRVDLMRTLFAEPLVRISGLPAGPDPAGMRGDPAPTVMQPFEEATLRHVVRAELHPHGLRGVFSDLG